MLVFTPPAAVAAAGRTGVESPGRTAGVSSGSGGKSRNKNIVSQGKAEAFLFNVFTCKMPGLDGFVF